jgi:hypothetical protein
MFTFILGMFVGAFLGTLAVALCVAAGRSRQHDQTNDIE